MWATHDPKGKLGDDGTIENRILSFEPERMLSIRVFKAPKDLPSSSSIGSMWTVLDFEPAADCKTRVRIVGLGFASDAGSQRMKGFFRQGNAYTLTQLQKRFPP